MALERTTDLIYQNNVDPTGSEDFAAGFTYGDDWRNTSSGEIFTCTGDGVWKNVTQFLTVGSKIKTGSYTGDGNVTQAITGVGFQPKYLHIIERETSDNSTSYLFFTTDVIIDDIAGGSAIRKTDLNVFTHKDNRIKSLDSDGFTVSDDSIDAHPNKTGIVYNYIAFG